MADWDKRGGLMDEVLTIRMHTKVTKGGRNLSFAALVAVGNGNGRVGLGYGKAPGVPMAIEKANKEARENMFEVPLIGDTVCHEETGRHKSSEVLLKPASPGTGVKAGGTVRAIMQVLGVHNVLTKSLGRNNPLNLSQATMIALRRMRSVEEVEELRGVPIFLKHPQIEEIKREQEPEEMPEEVEAQEEQPAEEAAAAAPEEEAKADSAEGAASQTEVVVEETAPAEDTQPTEESEEK